jgi:hypothetical protein
MNMNLIEFGKFGNFVDLELINFLNLSFYLICPRNSYIKKQDQFKLRPNLRDSKKEVFVKGVFTILGTVPHIWS